MFTVLMSVYDGEKPLYLTQSLQSLVNQTIVIPEIILMIDGPISASLRQIINNFINLLPIKTIENRDNIGLAKSLNIGLNHATYEIIFRFDTDDICVSNRFEIQLNAILLSNADVLGGQIIEFDDIKLDNVNLRIVPCDYFSILHRCKLRNPINHMTVVYKKSVILKYGGYPNIKSMEDYALWVKLLVNNCIIINMPNILVYARAGKNMIKRRGGTSYLLSEFHLQSFMFHLGFKNFFQALFHFFIRACIFLLPYQLKIFFYTYILRTRV